MSSAYDAVDDMGGTLPVSEVISSLASAIRTIPTGIDGNELEYGLTDGTLPLIGVAKVGSVVI